MKREELFFERPDSLQATAPPEARGLARDEVRLMVSTAAGHEHTLFRDLPRFLDPGDLLVVNRSATLAASLRAKGPAGAFLLNLATDLGRGLWLAEPRWSESRPGPLPLAPGAVAQAVDVRVHFVTPYPGLPRLWFVRLDGDARAAMACCGRPIRYAYLDRNYALAAYQTLFAAVPGSAEMPSAGRPFTPRVVDALRGRGVELAGVVLHTGVSSLEVEADVVEEHVLSPEPFCVPAGTARAVNAAREAGRRVVAVGTTVVRALESAWDGERVRPSEGMTRIYVHPGRPVHTVDGLLTGFHDPLASHLAMLYAVAGAGRVRSAYAEAVREGYLWHEFGDSHLLLR